MLHFKKECSLMLVRLLQQGTFKQLNATFSRMQRVKSHHKVAQRKENPRSRSTPCLTTKLSQETGQWSSPFAFLLLLFSHLAAVGQLPRPIEFLTWHLQGHVTTQCHLSQLPILQEKKILSPGPHNPTTCNASLHTLPSRELLEDACSSHDQASETSFMFTSSNPDEFDEHNIWNPTLGLICKT